MFFILSIIIIIIICGHRFVHFLPTTDLCTYFYENMNTTVAATTATATDCYNREATLSLVYNT